MKWTGENNASNDKVVVYLLTRKGAKVYLVYRKIKPKKTPFAGIIFSVNENN